MSAIAIEQDETTAISKPRSMAELIARVRNLNLPTVAESAHELFSLLKADPILYGQMAEKLVHAHCLEMMRMHFRHSSLTIWDKSRAPKIALRRIEQVRTEAMASNLHVAVRQMRERLMNLRICGGNIQLRDASRADIQRHCDFIRRQIEGEILRLRFFEAVAAQMKDGERVHQRFTEDDLLALRAQAKGVPIPLQR